MLLPSFKRIFTAFSALLAVALASPSAAARDFRVAFVGDPQVDDSTELDYARRTVYRELRESRNIDLAVIMGDIVNDRPELMAPSRASLDSLPFPYLCIPGNHDERETFRRTFGYMDTTFVAVRKSGKWRLVPDSDKGVRFILMNNNRDDRSSGLSEGQKLWLSGIIASAPQSQEIVLATHVPLKYCKGRDSLYAIVGQHPRLLLVSAHLHQVFRSDIAVKDGVEVEEIGVGATCGSWWRGVREPALIRGGAAVEKRGTVPNARMNCGAPRGYFIVDFSRDGSYRSHYKAVGREAADQFSLSSEGDSLFVNAYGGHVNGKVELEMRGCDGRKIRVKCRRTDNIAPEVRDIIRYNDSFSRKERRRRRGDFIPMRRLASPHLWSCAVPEGIVIGGDTEVRVIYSDRTMSFSGKVTPERRD